nr:MAG TPA: hypothetical protein [Caudoviricetes sp.]
MHLQGSPYHRKSRLETSRLLLFLGNILYKGRNCFQTRAN